MGDASYKSQIPGRQLDKGVVSYGSRARARRAMAKLLRGEPLSVAFIGGSITWCAARLPACPPARLPVCQRTGVHSPAAPRLSQCQRVSACRGAGAEPEPPYPAATFTWLNQTFPNAAHRFKNGAVPAVPSRWGQAGACGRTVPAAAACLLRWRSA